MMFVVYYNPYTTPCCRGIRFAGICNDYHPLFSSLSLSLFSTSISLYSLSLSLYLSAGLSLVPHVYIDYNEFELSLCHMGICNKKRAISKVGKNNIFLLYVCLYLTFKHKPVKLKISFKRK